MIDGLKSYPAYRDSGTAWLGEVPKHWEVIPNRAIFLEVKESDPDEQMLSVTINRGVIAQKELLADSSKKDSSRQDRSAYKLVRPGDIVYNKMRAWQGAIGVSAYQGIVSPAYIVMRSRNGNIAGYFHNLYRTPAFATEAESWSYGIASDMWSLRPEHFKAIYSCLPPIDEQRAIVRFLNHADGHIRRAIQAKQKLIKLLEEERQAIIHRAVTRGLNPNARLKASGEPWLGEIPEHWTLVALARCIKTIEQGWSPVPAEGELAAEQWAVLSLSAVKGGRFVRDALKPISMTADVPTHLEVRQGDILVTRSNTRNLVGDVCIVDEVRPRTIISDLIYRLKVNDVMIVPELLKYQLLSKFGRYQIERDARGSSGTMPKIGQGHIRRWSVLLPPQLEQAAIVRKINFDTLAIENAIRRTKQQITLISEFRTRIVSDVVTGKLDVRKAAAKLPEDTTKFEPLDESEDLTQDEDAAEGEELEAAEDA